MNPPEAGRFRQQGLDLILEWPDLATARLHNWRDSRDGVRGELTVSENGITQSWGSWTLASTTTRDQLAKRLSGKSPKHPWAAYLEEAARRFTAIARTGDPIAILDGQSKAEAEVLLPGWLYAGEPTLLYADGDTGKSMTALLLAIAMQTGTPLPAGLTPTRPVVSAYLDWETSLATTNTRLKLLSAGLGIPPPPLIYKRMVRPLVEEIGSLASELASRKVGFVVIDSKMFAVSNGEGAAFHEPITAFYAALRLFAPAAVLVLNHITNADAKNGTKARPFGGAFAFNSPRVTWEARRDPTVLDATSIVFTARKANNLPRRPDTFGLTFRGNDSVNDTGAAGITVKPFSLDQAEAQLLTGAGLKQRIRALLSSPVSLEDLLEQLPRANPKSVLRILYRLKKEFVATKNESGEWLATVPDVPF
jgi:hypothetical protein